MNSLNYSGPTLPREISKEARPSANLPLSAFAHSNAQAVGATSKQRALVSALVLGVQVVFVLGLTYGLTQKDKIELPPMVVSLLPESVEKPEPPPPPPKPVILPPQILMNMPPPVEIYVPPPLVKVQGPPSPITATNTKPPSDPNVAIETYQVKLLRHVNRNLRYPTVSRSRRQEGVVMVRFTMDRQGKVTQASIDKACEFEPLNEESLAMLMRAQPLPPPPPELEGDTIEMLLPVKFSLKNAR